MRAKLEALPADKRAVATAKVSETLGRLEHVSVVGHRATYEEGLRRAAAHRSLPVAASARRSVAVGGIVHARKSSWNRSFPSGIMEQNNSFRSRSTTMP
jgi:hypothetical protein